MTDAVRKDVMAEIIEIVAVTGFLPCLESVIDVLDQQGGSNRLDVFHLAHTGNGNHRNGIEQMTYMATVQFPEGGIMFGNVLQETLVGVVGIISLYAVLARHVLYQETGRTVFQAVVPVMIQDLFKFRTVGTGVCQCLFQRRIVGTGTEA